VPELVFQPLPIPRPGGDRLAHLRDVRLQGNPSRLLGADRIEHRVGCGVWLAAPRDRLGESVLAGADEAEFLFQRQPTLGSAPVTVLEAPERLRDGGAHHVSIESGGDGFENGSLEDGLREMEVVATDGRAALPVVGATVEVPDGVRDGDSWR